MGSVNGAMAIVDDREQTALRRRLETKFRLDEKELLLPRSSARYAITLPRTFDPLLDASADDPEQNLPYWAVTWPSGTGLGDVLLSERVPLRGVPVLELGCGLGVTATAALAAGAELIVTDYAPEALMLCRLNARRNTGREPRTLQLNWRKPRATLFEQAGDGFPVVLAADVLYEARDVAPLLDLVERVTAPRGLLWLAEPGRRPAARFLEGAAARGWSGTATEWDGPWPDPKDEGVIVRVHQMRRRPRAVRHRQRLDKKR